ncbi:hypothetical protein MtrunA17_Chr3g0083851 [Medicago truncatula]|uniref:Uncharacterized protein n=1 Tax=Medicago truncatula TaxID=3880 RepID=A0A396IN66_MEDTR|nr:hypothetical protein MtrunA17_Chr3g0083851 [Medicago truncatula]
MESLCLRKLNLLRVHRKGTVMDTTRRKKRKWGWCQLEPVNQWLLLLLSMQLKCLRHTHTCRILSILSSHRFIISTLCHRVNLKCPSMQLPNR